MFNRRSHRCVSSRGITSSTVDTDEVTRFNRLASGWRDSTNILHTMNALRVPLVRDAMVRHRAAPSKNHQEAMDSATPLKGMTILDVGCGGGILCEVGSAVNRECAVLFLYCNLQLFHLIV